MTKLITLINQIEKWAEKYYGKNWYSDEALGDIKQLRRILDKAKQKTKLIEIIDKKYRKFVKIDEELAEKEMIGDCCDLMFDTK